MEASSLIGGLSARLCGVSQPAEQDTPGLLQALAQVPDPRDARGRIHPLPGLLAIAVAAVASGQSRVVEIAEWAADLPDAVWDRLGAARDRFTGARRVPDDSTFTRVLAGIDADALDAAVCRWLIGRAGSGESGRRVIAVDGKTLCGSGPAGVQVHLLAALDQRDQIVLAQTDVDGKTNEVRREALCRIPNSVGRNSEERSWVRWLTWIRKVKGTGACHEYRCSCPDARSEAPRDPRDMAKAGLPEPQSPVMQVFIHRNMASETGAASCVGLFRYRRNFRDVGRCPVRAFKGMSGAPTSR
ncbi:transposase family protein [Micromonospora sp. ATA51]|uniref:transposase family protein n=1 Tax=Micromonospora sp. ATA51 TaxID=2806098 RepID=UPI001EE3F1FE|nr:transposase family protein [Micromonospora sp. ATA51]